jgi:hypothetical protein
MKSGIFSGVDDVVDLTEIEWCVVEQNSGKQSFGWIPLTKRLTGA